jgi:tRNA nucleotidyltransferase (CCA-adding enzyme)
MKAGQLFSHEADIGVRGIGVSKAEAFEQAALAMTAVITDPSSVKACEMVQIECEASDDELLLVDWLNALIYEMSARKMLFGRFSVVLDDGRLYGRAWGEPINLERHQPAVEIKGATYTTLRVASENGAWVAQTVVDV